MSDTSKTNWKHNDIVTEHDFNRLEKSIYDAHQQAYITKTYQQKAFSMPEEAKSGFTKSIEIKGQTIFNSVDGDMRTGNTGWSFSHFTTNPTYSTEQSYLGTESLKIVKDNANGWIRKENFRVKSSDKIFVSFMQYFTSFTDIGTSYCALYDTGSFDNQELFEQSVFKTPIVLNTWQHKSAIYTVQNTRNARLGLFGGSTDTYTCYIDAIIVINLTSLGLQDKTADEINNMIAGGYFEGLQDVEANTVNSCGNNLFDIGSVSEYLQTGNVSVQGNRLTYTRTNGGHFSGALLRVFLKNNANYTLSYNRIQGGLSSPWVRILDNNFNLESLAGGNTRYTFTVSQSGVYNILFTDGSFTKTLSVVENIQLEQGSIAIPYEPYRSSAPIKIATVGHKLPNGVADRICMRDGKWYREQNIGVHVLQSSDITGMHVAYENLDYAKISRSKLIGISHNSASEAFGVDTGYISHHQQKADGDYDNNQWIGYYDFNASTVDVWVGFVNNTDLSIARETLVGKEVIYQLAEPIITELDINPNFLIYENILIETDTVVPEVKLEYCGNSAAVRERNTIVHDLNNKRYKENQIKTIMGVV